MPPSVRRVTVVGAVRRLDLVVPARATVAELTADVVPLAAEPVEGAALPRWVLSDLRSGDLPADETLEAAAVPDGAVLHLRRIDEPVVGLQSVDLVERVAAGGAAGPPPAVDRVVLAGSAAVVLAAVGWLLLREATPVAAAVAGGLGLLAVAGGRRLAATGHAGTGVAAALLALASVPLLAVGAAIWAGSGLWAGSAPSPGGSVGRVAAALAGAAAGGMLTAAAVRAARPAGAALAALGAASALSVLLSLPLTPDQAAAIAGVAAVLAVPVLPRVVLRACGIRVSDGSGRARPAALVRAREALPWSLGAAGAVTVGSGVVLARGPEGADLPLAAVLGLLLVLRSRDRRGTAESLPLAVAGQLTLAAAGVGLALRHPAVAPLAVLVAVVAAYAVAAGVTPSAVDRPRWAQRRRRLEALALVAAVPLLAAVLGLFGVVVEVALRAE